MKATPVYKNKDLTDLHLQDCPNETWTQKDGYELSNWGRANVDGQMVVEEWRDVTDYEGYYQVSCYGRVKGFKRNVKGRHSKQVIKSRILLHGDLRGYKRICLCINSVKKSFITHRLVAKIFVPNPYNKPQVNHIDEIKYNNFYLNLNWMTRIENQNHGTGIKRKSEKLINGKGSKKVNQFDLQGNFIKEWISMAESSRNGFNAGAICGCCKGKIKTHKGFKWEYAN